MKENKTKWGDVEGTLPVFEHLGFWTERPLKGTLLSVDNMWARAKWNSFNLIILEIVYTVGR